MERVKDLMTKKVVTIPGDMGIEQICNILNTNSLSGVPVINEENKLIGFVSERDIIAAIAAGDFSDKKARDIMCPKVTTVNEDMSLSQVSRLFSDKPFRHFPVINKDEVVGIISRKDVLRKVSSE